jgi:membrane protease YdiL (CAAX protease family)
MAALSHQPVGDDADPLGPASTSEAWRWLVVAAVGYLVGSALGLVFVHVGAAIAGTKGGVAALSNEVPPPLWFRVTEFAGLWCGFGGAAVAVTRHGRRVGLRFHPRDIWYVFLGFALQILLGIAYSGVHERGLSHASRVLLGGAPGWLYLIPAILTICGAPLFEELLFRGTLLRGLLGVLREWPSWIGVTVAVVIDGTVFGIAHLGTDQWIQLPGLAAVGVVLAVLAIHTRRLGPSIMTHAAFNAVTVYAYWATH